MRDERHAEHVACDAVGFFRRLRELDAAAFAAAARVDLRLHDDDFRAEPFCNRRRVRGIGSFFSTRHGHTVMREDGLRLVLVDFHSGCKLLMLTCGSP